MRKLPYRRPLGDTLLHRLMEPRRFLQVLAGPRQVGKTTLARQVLEELRRPSSYASADAALLEDRPWIEEQWHLARHQAKRSGGSVLVLDEIQKVRGWSDVVKRLWDEDSLSGLPLQVVLLGSSPLPIERGLTESLAGRFELLRAPHWNLEEMRSAFGFSLEEYVYFGGYPGAAPLAGDRERWARYVLDSLVETTVSRDILLLVRVDKPALLRRLFHLGCEYSGQVLSYQKMLGQLQDAGNTTTLAHYLDLLSGAGMLTGLAKFSGQRVRQRGSSPKLQVLNTALMSAVSPLTLGEARADREHWGRLVESAVGAHLLNCTEGTPLEVSYWRDRGREVDFVTRRGDRATAIEVKSGRRRGTLPGMAAFLRAFPGSRPLLVGADGVPLEEFLLEPAQTWLGS